MENVRPKKSLGQHFLTDQRVLRRIVDAAHPSPGETIVEVGPGQGALTGALLQAGARVIAIEKDESLAESLEQTFGSAALTVVTGDILEVNLNDYVQPGAYRVVANIPYYLSGRLLRYFYEEAPRPKELILLLQKEVAERVTAGAGEMSLLSLATRLHGEADILFPVPAAAFRPAPKVESALVRVRLNPRPSPLAPSILRLARLAFAGRRKQLRNSLSAGLRLDSGRVENLLTAAGIVPTARPQELSADDWQRLTALIEGHG